MKKSENINHLNGLPTERYDQNDMATALKILQDGGIILYPTDTVWGIGCDATNREAVKKIFKLKQREDAKSMLVLVGSEGQLQQVVENVPETAWMLLDSAVNPITIIYDRPINIADNLKAEDGSVGIRITNELFSKSLCQKLRRPIVSTSANITGKKTPTNFSEISEEIINGVDYVVRFRQQDTSKKQPSNIVKISDSEIIKVIR